MKCETLNGILTFVLGVLVVLAVVFAVRMTLLTHELRTWQKRVAFCQAVFAQTRAVAADAEAYNQKYYDPALTRILQGGQAQPATR